MSRIPAAFAAIRERARPGLIPYLTVGYPSVAATLELVPALVEGGADLIELGVPFSDPLADGTTIQRSTFHALQQGVTLSTCLDVVATLRSRGVGVPLVLMGYLNPFLAYGLDRFFADAETAGVDGLIAVDATLDVADELTEAALGSPIDLIQLVAPTTTDERLRRLLPAATGFVYCVSVAGTTGARGDLPPSLPELVARVKRFTQLPVAVGFGVSKPEHVASIGRLCEAAVIGSALVEVIEHSPPERLVRRVRDYVEEITGRAGSRS
jgi:tryptophan synthase alpha chain